MYYTEIMKELRKEKKKTQEQIAKELNIPREQYRRYETGVNEIKVSFLKKICEYYNVSADYILGLPQGLEYPKR